MKPSKWKVTMQFLDGAKMYAVYRLRDVNAVDHSGNREYASGYLKSEEQAEAMARNLNSFFEEEAV